LDWTRRKADPSERCPKGINATHRARIAGARAAGEKAVYSDESVRSGAGRVRVDLGAAVRPRIFELLPGGAAGR